MAYKYLIQLGMVLSTPVVFSQQIKDVRAEKSKEGFLISYSLLADSADQNFEVSVYSSIDEFSKPLTNLSGDTGEGVNAGLEKKIHWNPDEITRNYKKPFQFEVRAIRPQLWVKNSQKSYKRGTEVEISWQVKAKNSVVNITLLRNDAILWNSSDVKNTGKFQLILPLNLKPGNGYRFRLSYGTEIYSSRFSVKRRASFAAKAGMACAVIAAALLVPAAINNKNQSEFPAPPGSPK